MPAASGGLSSGVAAVKCGQFFVGNELAAASGIHSSAHGCAFLVGQAEHVFAPPFDFIDGLSYLSEQFLGQSGDAFEQIVPFRTHERQIAWREFACPARLVYD